MVEWKYIGQMTQCAVEKLNKKNILDPLINCDY